jgi:hypothetical protein
VRRTTQPDTARLADFVPAAFFALLAVTTVLVAAMAAPAKGQMAVVFPPMTSELTAWALVRQAGGLIVAPTQLPNVVVAYAPDETFQSRVQSLGALFLFAAEGLCAPSANED